MDTSLYRANLPGTATLRRGAYAPVYDFAGAARMSAATLARARRAAFADGRWADEQLLHVEEQYRLCRDLGFWDEPAEPDRIR